MPLKTGLCKYCGNPYSSNNKNPQFCSLPCWYDFRRENKIPSGTKEDYKKRAKTLSKKYKTDKEWVKKKSSKQGKTIKQKIKLGLFDVRRFKGHKHTKKAKKLISRKSRINIQRQFGKGIFPNSYIKQDYYSEIEKPIKKILNSLNLFEKKGFFHNKGIKTNVTVRFPDFLLPHHKIIIECDGYYWHKNSRLKDSKRDKELIELGFAVLHFKEKEILYNFDKVKEVIKSNVERIKSIEFVGEKEVGDLSMTQNHNFILKNGIVVHNTETHAGAGNQSINN